jgi:hypothetical protein
MLSQNHSGDVSALRVRWDQRVLVIRTLAETGGLTTLTYTEADGRLCKDVRVRYEWEIKADIRPTI